MSNREIKFRAWDWHNMLQDPKIWYIEWIYDYPINNEFSLSNDIYMQYTWLKDQNWNEIYEWDILDYTNAQIIISIRWDYTWANRQFDECGIFGDSFGNFDLGVARHCIIIWNIYENPDLLGQ